MFIFTSRFFFLLFFFSVDASGTLHFYSDFSVNALAGLKFWYDYIGLRLGKPRPGQKRIFNDMCEIAERSS